MIDRRLMTSCLPILIALSAALFSRAGLADVPIGTITLSGDTLYEDGQPWIPAGFTYLKMNGPGEARLATEISWLALFDAQIEAFGADTVRMQVYQGSLDPEGAERDDAYLARLVEAVDGARSRGLAVILSMKGRQGTGTPLTVPTKVTDRAWQVLTEHFNSDLGIMYQLYNEPIGKGSGLADGWEGWRNALQHLVDVVRSTGSQNVLIASGKNAGHSLAGAPELEDPEEAVAYSVHPYPVEYRRGNRRGGYASLTRADWDRNFGEFCRGERVCLITEWMTGSGTKCLLPNQVEGGTPALAKDFLDYLHDNEIAMAGAWAFDHLNPQFTLDYKMFQPNSFEADFRCARGAGARGGPGELLKKLWDLQ